MIGIISWIKGEQKRNFFHQKFFFFRFRFHFSLFYWIFVLMTLSPATFNFLIFLYFFLFLLLLFLLPLPPLALSLSFFLINYYFFVFIYFWFYEVWNKIFLSLWFIFEMKLEKENKTKWIDLFCILSHLLIFNIGRRYLVVLKAYQSKDSKILTESLVSPQTFLFHLLVSRDLMKFWELNYSKELLHY